MIRFRELLVPLLVATALTLSSCASTPTEEVAQKCPSTMPMDEWITGTTERNPSITIKHLVLKGDAVMVFMAAFNATPPVSNYDPDSIVIFVAPTDPRAVVGFSKDECLISVSAYPLGAVSAWMNGKPIQLRSQSKNSKKKTS